MAQTAFSNDSVLTRTFAERVGRGLDGRKSMLALVKELRGSKPKASKGTHLGPLLQARNVSSLEHSDTLCDGSIQPIGETFEAGFKMFVSQSSGVGRRRFTVAHELCHTFFYEYVPEIKFLPHETDNAEEALCNLGAAELLMPSRSLRREAKALPVCIDSAALLASLYSVSLEAMTRRLRELSIWDVELSSWRRMTNGSFALERIVGARRVAWSWADEDPLRETWASGKRRSGRTFVMHRDERSNTFTKPVRFELERRGDHIIALWGSSLAEGSATPSLFES